MKKVAAVLLCSALITSMLTGGASPAAAQSAGAMRFSCQMELASWPGSGSALCVGEVTGVGIRSGAPIACVPVCDFLAAVHNYSELCAGSEPPLIGNYSGEIFIGGVRVGDFVWLRVGTKIYFVPPGSVEGQAVWIPKLPIPTCANEGSLTVDIHGWMSFV